MLDVLHRTLDGAGEVREAGPDDVVDGVPAVLVARPTTVEGVSALLRETARAGLVTVARGAGTALDWGAPPERVDLLLDTSGLDRVVEHGAGDLVVVTEAGVRLDRLAEQLAGAGQELVAEVPRERVAAGSTVGGALATAASGPRRLARGALRDLVLGTTVVRADGVVASSGGKVVKNVAGYDLGKLMTGSYGTLGVVVRAAFRLHPLPAARSFAVVPGDLRSAAGAALRLVSSQLAPAAVEIDRPAGSDRATVAVLFEGAAPAAAARRDEAASVTGGSAGEEPAWWGHLPGVPGDVLLKITTTLPGVADVLAAARVAEQAHGVPVALRGSAAGVLYAAVPHDADPSAVAVVVAALRPRSPGDGTLLVLRAPAGVRAAVDAWGAVPGIELMRRVKEQFDPQRLLAPGRFVGGI
ncbi:MAG TPA: FAD-binding oxidoreductase [Blastococcus sp.]|nr:FAD-binding oxidoreductase [Blastococcus sp.]